VWQILLSLKQPDTMQPKQLERSVIKRNWSHDKVMRHVSCYQFITYSDPSLTLVKNVAFILLETWSEPSFSSTWSHLWDHHVDLRFSVGVKQHEADLHAAEIRDSRINDTLFYWRLVSLTKENANGIGRTERTAIACSRVRKGGEPCDLNN